MPRGRLPQPIKPRFESFVKKTNSCWTWTGSHTGKDPKYGRMRVGGKLLLAHRISYELYKSPIPINMKVCHACDVSLCVNPNHLFLGTQSDNMMDCSKKNRSNKPKGKNNPITKITEEQAREIKNSTESYSITAQKYGISKSLVAAIRKNLIWNYV